MQARPCNKAPARRVADEQKLGLFNSFLGGSYFEVSRVSEVWQDKLQVEFWRQPLQATCDEFVDAGFLIERIFEPRPSPELQQRFPDEYQKLSQVPAFIVFALRSVSI